MIKEEFYYNSADSKTKVHAVKWTPTSNIRAIIQISHGVTEHILRYDEFAKYMNQKGILVVGNDHLGHGQSMGTPMYFGKEGSWNYIVKDMHTCREIIQSEYPDVPYFMLGFSLGSFALRTYLIDYIPKIKGAIIIGTGHNSKIEFALANFITKKEIKKYGEEKSTPTIKSLTFDTYNKLFKPNKTDYDWLSLSKKNIEDYINDPLRGESMSAGLFRELLRGMRYTSQISNIKKMNLNTKILLLSGEKDPVGGQTKGVNKVFKLLKKANIDDVKLKYYSDLRHDILHEDNKEEIYEFIYNWLISKMN